MAILECSHVRRTFGGVVAVDDCSLIVKANAITGLIGPNGAGKSTLLAILGGSVAPQQGTVRFLDQDITASSVDARGRAGLIRTFQLGSDFPRLTVLENLLVASQDNPGESFGTALFRRRLWKSYERTKLAEARAMVTDIELERVADEYAGNLSGGQRRLLEIGRALMAHPKLLLLDEPMVGVNPMLRSRLIKTLHRVKAEGVACLVVEHALDVVEQLCDSVSVMIAGRVVMSGSMEAARKDERVVAAYLG